MMMKVAFFGLMVAVAVPAIASPTESTASAKLAAEISITESRTRVTAADSGDYIELAQAYLRAGRTGDAATAYRAALARDNIMMLTRQGDSIWSHKVARMALAMMPQIAAR